MCVRFCLCVCMVFLFSSAFNGLLHQASCIPLRNHIFKFIFRPSHQTYIYIYLLRSHFLCITFSSLFHDTFSCAMAHFCTIWYAVVSKNLALRRNFMHTSPCSTPFAPWVTTSCSTFSLNCHQKKKVWKPSEIVFLGQEVTRLSSILSH